MSRTRGITVKSRLLPLSGCMYRIFSSSIARASGFSGCGSVVSYDVAVRYLANLGKLLEYLSRGLFFVRQEQVGQLKGAVVVLLAMSVILTPL